MPLYQTSTAGRTLMLQVQPPMVLSNKGGIITLLDERGRKVLGVSCTKQQARNIDWTLAF